MSQKTPDEERKNVAVVQPLRHDSAPGGELVTEETLVREMLDLERQRIASADKKTDTARMFIEAQDASDKRQYEFSMDKLVRDDTHRTEKHKLARVVVLAGGASLILCVFGLLGMMFFGNPEQSVLAMDAMKYLFVGGAGYGLVSGIVAATKKMINDNQ